MGHGLGGGGEPEQIASYLGPIVGAGLRTDAAISVEAIPAVTTWQEAFPIISCSGCGVAACGYVVGGEGGLM